MALQRWVRKEGVVSREIDGEGILYNPETKSMHVLNKTAFAFWRLCDGKHDSAQVAGEIKSRFEVDKGDDVLSDINRIFNQLEKLQLVERRK